MDTTPEAPDEKNIKTASAQQKREAPTGHSTDSTNAPVTLILQWLTYAAWGWFALAMLWLSAVTIAFFVGGSQTGEWASVVSYPLAAVIVLFLIAAVIDFFYARREPAHKKGVGVVLTVIHAVIFALCGIGAIIVALFALINMFINGSMAESGNDRIETVLYSSLVLVVIYAVLLARTVLVGKVKRIVMVSWILLTILAAVTVTAAITGPTVYALVTKQDRLIETALPTVAGAIRDYTERNDRLPTSLNDIVDAPSYSNAQSKDAITSELIRYTPNTKPTTTVKDTSLAGQLGAKSAQVFSYRLCVTYKAESNPGSYYDDYSSPRSLSQGTVTDPEYIYNVTRHDSGETCYDLSATTDRTVDVMK